jgi:hypothetical protein
LIEKGIGNTGRRRTRCWRHGRTKRASGLEGSRYHVERGNRRKKTERNGILHYEFLEKKLVTQSLIYKLESVQRKKGGKVSYVTN